jgi:hypothetical protein
MLVQVVEKQIGKSRIKQMVKKIWLPSVSKGNENNLVKISPIRVSYNIFLDKKD